MRRIDGNKEVITYKYVPGPFMRVYTKALKNKLRASNYSGKAINISRTTAPHSMSYELTSLYNIAHGHAVALCLVPCWKLLLDKSKSDNELNSKLDSLSKILKQDDIVNSINYVNSLITELDLPKIKIKEEDLDILVDSVNIERMHNNPIIFDRKEIYNLYKSIE